MNITNGNMLSEFLVKYNINSIPFNETFLCGPILDLVFDEKFISNRVAYINYYLCSLTKEQYLSELSGILELNFDQEFVLWFDEDLFCQINCLVLLVYLQQNNVKRVQLNIVKQNFFKFTFDNFITNSVEIELDEKISELFENRNNKYFTTPIDYFSNFCTMYNNYEKEINLFLNNNLNSPTLVELTLNEFKHYGVTDLYIYSLIKNND